jgi:carbonic anhydrase/acetyltransferase-like protein (isoleucine patch superfamily)
MPEFELNGVRPRVHPTAYVAPTASIIGEVEVGPNASIWFGAVIRADHEPITVGRGANIQDNAVVHCAEGLPTLIGPDVTIGHAALLEGCVVEEGSLVGMGSIMLQQSRLGAGSILAAGSVLGEGQEIPPGSLAAGSPAQVKKPVSGSSARWVTEPGEAYRQLARRYRAGLSSGLS